MRKAGLGEQSARLQIVVLMHQYPPRQDTERSLDDAHVLIEHEMMDVGAIEQSLDRRNQHDIVGAYQFPQISVLQVSHRVKSAIV